MKINQLSLNQSLFLFFNSKISKKQSVNDDNIQFFQATSRINASNKSKLFETPIFNSRVQKQWVDALNNYYHFPDIKFYSQGKTSVKLQIPNTNHLTFAQFLNQNFNNINLKLIFNNQHHKFNQIFVNNAFGFRGSFDYTGNFFTTDIHPTRQACCNYIPDLLKLLNLLNLSFDNQLNFNFRDLQKQQVQHKHLRASQFRINLRYVSNHFINSLVLVNPLRAKQFKINKELINTTKQVHKNRHRKGDIFWRFKFFHETILNEGKLSLFDIKKMRKKLKFGSLKSSHNTKQRNEEMMERVRIEDPNICASCGSKLSMHPKLSNEKRYQVHHVIPFAFGKKYDINTESPMNMVKICCNCHDDLRKNGASKDLQRKIIKNIFHNKPMTKYFVENVQKALKSHISPVAFDQKTLQ